MVIEAKNISKRFGENEVLCGVSLRASSEKPTVITGDSGSGKTTLLRIILGLENMDKGKISFFDSEANEINRNKVRFSAVFQEDRLLDSFDAVENIALSIGMNDHIAIKTELLRLLPEDALGKPVCFLSGGQRRRIAIVRACLANADIVILDEPFSGLDPENTKKAWKYIMECCAGKPVIMAVHEPDVPQHCNVLSVQ